MGATAAAICSLPGPSKAETATTPTADTFPSTDPRLAREIVSVSHFNVDRVRELVTEDRALALASWDWGFGDWETALGAASHMGRRDIAEVLIEHGARPNLFTWAMLDKVDVVRAACEGSAGIQSIRGPHGITLLSHARAGKAARVEKYLLALGGADESEPRLDLSEEQAAVYLGDYAATDSGLGWVVERNRRGGIGLVPAGGTHRPLHRTGDHVFSPSGAPHVVVRFSVEDGRATGFTLHRGRPIGAAVRVGS